MRTSAKKRGLGVMVVFLLSFILLSLPQVAGASGLYFQTHPLSMEFYLSVNGLVPQYCGPSLTVS